jgi:hypothetical protein
VDHVAATAAFANATLVSTIAFTALLGYDFQQRGRSGSKLDDPARARKNARAGLASIRLSTPSTTRQPATQRCSRH